MREKMILDPCCGSRMMWFDRESPCVVFGDNRSETLVVSDRSHGKAVCDQKHEYNRGRPYRHGNKVV